MTRIAKPYLKELIDLKDGSAFKTLTLKFAKRLGLRPVDINMAVTQPRRTAFTEDVVRRLEQGEFKLRVRALESERKLERQEIVMSNIFSAVVAGVAMNAAVALTVLAGVGGAAGAQGAAWKKALAWGAKLTWVAFAVAAARVPLGMKKVRALDQYFEKFGRGK